MRRLTIACLAVGAMGCATVPPGPTDADVRAVLDTRVQRLAHDLLQANAAGFAAQFAPDGEMLVSGVQGPNGMIDVDLKGRNDIQSFVGQSRTPMDFSMTVATFSRTGAEAHQAGTWLMEEETGTFSLDWREAPDGTWQVTRGHFARGGGQRVDAAGPGYPPK